MPEAFTEVRPGATEFNLVHQDFQGQHWLGGKCPCNPVPLAHTNG